jgi:hypothetical protein
MRHLFLPAYLCLATLPIPTGSDSGVSLEQFFGANTLTRVAETPARANDQENEDVVSTIADHAVDAPNPPATEPPIPLPVVRPTPKPVIARSDKEICDTLVEAAQSNDLPVPFFIHLLFQESSFKPDAVSRAGAQGIAQFMPETAANVGLDNPFDPLQAIAASARLLRDLVRQFGNVGLAAAAYNAGPRRIQDWLSRKGKLPDETKHYVKTITGRPAETWTSGMAAHPALPLPRQAPCRDAAVQIASNAPSAGREMIAMRAHVQLARLRAGKTQGAVAQRSSQKSASEQGTKPGAAPPRHVVKQSKGAIQLAAASRKKHRKVQLSQR